MGSGLCTGTPALVSIKGSGAETESDGSSVIVTNMLSGGSEVALPKTEESTVRTHPLGTTEERWKDATFHEVLVAAAQQLHHRQRQGQPEVSKAEMEDLVRLTREMDNLKNCISKRCSTIEGTWSILTREGTLEYFAQHLYNELLTTCPRLRVFFFGVDLDEQSRALIRMLGTAVHFYDKPGITVNMFTKAGARHRMYGITRDIFAEMENVFFKVFPRYVGDEVFQGAEAEWKRFWQLTLGLLENGNCSPEGERYGKLYQDQLVKHTQSEFNLIVSRQSETNLVSSFVAVMYGKATELHPYLTKFSALQDLRVAHRVFQAIRDIVENMHTKKKAEDYMRELGARHGVYEVYQKDLESFMEAFLFACRHFLAVEWNVAVESRFHLLFEWIVQSMVEGIEENVHSAENMRAPTDNDASFCLVFTDIESSTMLWQKSASSMSQAVHNHHRLIRSLIAEYNAYEVKTVGDSFIIAAKDVLVGLKISLSIQLELMRMAPIAPGFEMSGPTEGGGDPAAWHGGTLRVRIGLEHCTEATATYDSVHRRYDYYGPSVNRCARIEAAACGGQILMSRETFEYLKLIPEFHEEPCPGILRDLVASPSAKLDARGLDRFVRVSDVGLVPLRGISEPIHLVSMVPCSLAGRQFIDKSARGAHKLLQ